MRVVMLIGAAFLLSAQDPSQDEVHLKDGGVRKGTIVSEDETGIVLEVLIRNRKGQTVGSGRTRIDRKDILKVVRARKKDKEESIEKSEAFEERRKKLEEELEKISVTPATLFERDALRTTGTLFEVFSTCDDEFLRRATLSLERIFTAYTKYFHVRRNKQKKIRVYLFGSRTEYDDFQKRKFGGAIQNPAFYHLEDNYIAAFQLVQKKEADQARKEILTEEEEINELKKKIREEESKVRKLSRDYRNDILEEAAERTRQAKEIKDKEKRIRALRGISYWKQKELLALEKGKDEAEKYLKDLRSQLIRIQKGNRGVLSRNNRILEYQNRAMFETLYHEGFHAFAANYLWPDSADREFPRWLHEGMASYFEMSVVEMGDLVHGSPHPDFVQILKDNRDSGGLVPLSRILGAGGNVFVVRHRGDLKRSTVAYAQSWLLAHYLAGKTTADQIDRYVSDVITGKDNVKAFERMVGKKLDRFEKALLSHLDELK